MVTLDVAAAAAWLTITEAILIDLMAKPEFEAAYIDGRRQLAKSIHGSLIEQALEGHVPAIRLALSHLKNDPIILGDLKAKPAEAPPPDPAAAVDARVLSFAEAFERETRGRKVG